MNYSLLSLFRLRSILLVCFIGLTLFSGLSITFLSVRLSYTARANYTQEIGHLLSQAIAIKVENFLQDVEDTVELSDRFIFKVVNNKVDYSLLVGSLASNLIVNHNLGTALYTEEKTGYTLKISLIKKPNIKYNTREPSRFSESSIYTEKDIIVEEIIPNASGTFTLKTYSYPDFPNKTLSVDENGGFDHRLRPWYVLGKVQAISEKGRWTDCFFAKNNHEFKVGMSYATALGDEKGDFFAALGVRITTEWVSDFLTEAMEEMHKKGLSAFVIEQLPNKTKMILAHSLKENAFPKDQNGVANYYALPNEMKDPAIEKLIYTVPSEVFNGLEITGDFSNLFHYDVNGADYIGVIKTILPGVSPDWYLGLYVPERILFSNAYWHFYMAIGILVAVMIISVILSIILARSASKPIESLVLLAQKIGKLDFSQTSRADSRILEIKNLSRSMNLMQIGLQSFTRYLPKQVLESLFDTGTGAVATGKEKELTIMFTDIVNFTSFAEKLDPNELVLQLNEFLGCFTSAIYKHQGTVDKYIGDAVMAFWNAPNTVDNHEIKACKAAFEGMWNLRVLQKEWARLNKPIFQVRLGINTGKVIVGNVGTDERLSYTVVGDNVNLASRLEGLNKIYGTAVLISDSTLKGCKDQLVTRPIDLVAVKGKDKGILIHELFGFVGQVKLELMKLSEDSRLAFEIYLTKDWEAAMQLYNQILNQNPEDIHSSIMVDRCKKYMEVPPDQSWDGIHHQSTK